MRHILSECSWCGDGYAMLPERDITNIVEESTGLSVPRNRKCTAMILNNLADPMWISVNCDQNLVKVIFCYFTQKTTNISADTSPAQ